MAPSLGVGQISIIWCRLAIKLSAILFPRPGISQAQNDSAFFCSFAGGCPFKYFEGANTIWILWFAMHGGEEVGEGGTEDFPNHRQRGFGTFLLILAICLLCGIKVDFFNRKEQNTYTQIQVQCLCEIS